MRETGTFTIRDAILFHKFCIFNKEYFVFLAHPTFGCKCVTNPDWFVPEFDNLKVPLHASLKDKPPAFYIFIETPFNLCM